MVEDTNVYLVYYTHPVMPVDDKEYDEAVWDVLCDVGLASVYTPDKHMQEVHFDFACGCGDCDMCHIDTIEEAKLAIQDKLNSLAIQWRFGGQFDYGDG